MSTLTAVISLTPHSDPIKDGLQVRKLRLSIVKWLPKSLSQQRKSKVGTLSQVCRRLSPSPDVFLPMISGLSWNVQYYCTASLFSLPLPRLLLLTWSPKQSPLYSCPISPLEPILCLSSQRDLSKNDYHSAAENLSKPPHSFEDEAQALYSHSLGTAQPEPSFPS